MAVAELAHVALIVAAVGLLLAPSIVLMMLALASVGVVTRPSIAPQPTRFALFIAAHDEEANIAATVACARAVGRDAVTVHVVADNCADGTAAAAEAAGARVHRRVDPSRPGKAAALNWLADRVLPAERSADAVVIIDADTRIEPGFFDALGEKLAAGAAVVQAANLVRTTDAPLTRLRDLAFRLRCELRPLAYDRLGFSAGLHGNGMCFRPEILAGHRWNEGSVGEDLEMHGRLVLDGVRVRFARDAVVRSAMPERFGGAAGQALRWERGKFDEIRAGVRLIARGVAERRSGAIATGYDVFIPPLSLHLAASVGVALGGAAIGDAALTSVGTASLAGMLIYVSRGLSLARVGPITFTRMALWSLPYIAWKSAIVLHAIVGGGNRRWAQARPVMPLRAAPNPAQADQ